MKEIMQGINEVYNVLEGNVDSWKSLGEAAKAVHNKFSFRGIAIDDFVRLMLFCGL